jgi:hypothetical protein
VNLKGGKEGKKQPLISTDLLLYQSQFIEAMIGEIRKVVRKSLRKTRNRVLLQSPSGGEPGPLVYGRFMNVCLFLQRITKSKLRKQGWTELPIRREE